MFLSLISHKTYYFEYYCHFLKKKNLNYQNLNDQKNKLNEYEIGNFKKYSNHF